MNNWFFTIFCAVVAFQSLVFSIFLFQKGGKSNKYLAVYFIAQSLSILSSILSENHIKVNAQLLEGIKNFGYSFSLLWGPGYYLYIKSIFNKSNVSKTAIILHAGPFVLCFFFFMLSYLKIYIFHLGNYFDPPTFYSNWFFPNLLIGQVVLYCILSIRLLKISGNGFFLHDVKENVVRWAYFFIYGYVAGCAINLGIYLYVSFISTFFREPLTIISFLYFFVFFNIIFYKALLRPELFYDNDSESRKYHYSGLTKEQEEEYFSKLEHYMVTQLPFLMPGLSLKDLSQMLNISARQLSQVINTKEKSTFLDYINKYRVDYVKSRLQNPAHNKKTILELLYEAGFNSKTAFNVTFKKNTGCTPSQFKEKYFGE